MTSTTSFHIMQAAIQPTEAIKPLPSTLVRRLQAIVGKRYVLSAVEELATYECDGCVLVKAPPQVVVLPNTANEVAQVVKACHEFNIPFVARGAGTGLSGGALTSLGGVLIGMNRMNKIVSIDANNRRAVVQPGLVNAKLNQSLAPYGLFYAPDPSSQSACTIGGNLAENAGGIHCIRYGVTTDHMLSLEVVLPDGTLTRFNNPNRRSQGLNWVGLFVGSEGTLGICTEATVKLTPLPECTQVYLAAFTHEGPSHQCRCRHYYQWIATSGLRVYGSIHGSRCKPSVSGGISRYSRSRITHWNSTAQHNRSKPPMSNYKHY